MTFDINITVSHEVRFRSLRLMPPGVYHYAAMCFQSENIRAVLFGFMTFTPSYFLPGHFSTSPNWAISPQPKVILIVTLSWSPKINSKFHAGLKEVLLKIRPFEQILLWNMIRRWISLILFYELRYTMKIECHSIDIIWSSMFELHFIFHLVKLCMYDSDLNCIAPNLEC